MYDEARTNVKSVCRKTEDSMLNMVVHQGSALMLLLPKPYLSALAIDEFTKGVQEEAPWV